MRIRVTGIVLRGDEVLMVECSQPGIGVHLNFPGGGLDPGETLHQALVRELREECCLDVTPGRLLTVTEHWEDSTRLDTLCFTFEAIPTKGQEAKMSAQPDLYQTGVGWYRWADLASLKVLPPVGDAVQAAISTGVTGYAGDRPFVK
ncbi:MAG: NUDIX domain-containing protein [bacterium]